MSHVPPPVAQTSRARARARARARWALLLILLLPASVRAQTIEGIDSWAEAVVGVKAGKWVGQRVPFPTPSSAPASTGHVESLELPVRVHAGVGVDPRRAQRVLESVERIAPVLAAAGWLSPVTRDVYVVANASHGADAGITWSEPFGPYDSARAFALVDARVPASQLEVCTTQALLEAFLVELDPAEAASVRRASAAYVAWLATGTMGCDDDVERALEHPQSDPFDDPESAGGALWLARLGERQDHHRGTFLRAMWEFARQRTWEGQGLRASPDLFECIEQALELGQEKLEQVAGELSEQRVLSPFPRGVAPARPPVVKWDGLPSQSAAQLDPVIEPLGARYLWVSLEKPRPGQQLRVWSKGELGARWVLLVTRLNAKGESVGRISAPARKNPNSFLLVELDDRTTDVLVTVTNVGSGRPDADVPHEHLDKAVNILVDRGAAQQDTEAPATITIETSVGHR
jgi:hypothetical protein